MEVTIGVQNLARELVVDTDLSAEAVATAVADALGGAPALELTDVLVRAAQIIEESVKNLKKPRIVAENGRRIKQLEEEGDAVYHQAVGSLFRGDPNPLEVIKWKELYDTLERALDQCEDVANVLESIALKHA